MAFQTVRNSANAWGLQLRNPSGEKTPAFVYPAPSGDVVLFLTAGSVWKSAAAESTKGCRAGYRLGLTADTYRRAAVGTITGEESNVTCEKGDRGFLIYWRPQMAKSGPMWQKDSNAVACYPGNASARDELGRWTIASAATRIVACSTLSPRGQLCFPLDCPAKWWNSSLQHSAIRISYRYILHKWLRAKLLSLLEHRS